MFDNFDETTLVINKTKFSLKYANNWFYLQFREKLMSYPCLKFELDNPELHDNFLTNKIFELKQE